VKAWDDAWQTAEGRADWTEPEPFVRAALSTLPDQGAVRALDLGCGPGRHAVHAASIGFPTTAIDAAPSGVRHARDWARMESVALDTAVGDMGTLPFRDDSFGCIIAWNVIYHGTSRVIEQAASEIERCLAPDGVAILSLISKRNERFGRGREVERDTFVVEGDSGELSHPHRFFNRADLETLLAGFDILDARETTQREPRSYHWEILAQPGT